MFGSVKKIVSAFEIRKQPHHLPPSLSSLCSSSQNPSHIQQTPPLSTTPTPVVKTIPCLFTTPEPHPHPSQPLEHAPSACTLSQLAMGERYDGEGDKQNVVLRRSGEGRRIPRVRLRDSWPIGKLSCIERNFLSFVTIETKEPISFSKCPPEFDRRRLRPIHCKFSTGLNTTPTTSTTGLNTTPTTSTTELNTTPTTSTTGLNTTPTTSTTGLNTTPTTSTTGFNTTPTTSTTGLNTTPTTSSTGLNTTPTTSTTGLNTTSKARPSSPIGTNPSSAVSTTARGTYSCELAIEANANAHSELGHPALDCAADKSAFEPPEVSVFPKQVILGNAVAGTLGKGRGQGKGRAFQPQLRLRPSDTTFFTLLLLLRSGSSNSMIAIDNKIEQAMDLVKTHLMLAVREEVEVLREQIKELAERNAQLERENYILRALRENQ
ncbi:mucin-2 isoform X1 [Tachysurus fulvidraco]|uniref:mucin-2 isoform X1 n=1 Tax=Tachysurus fulvidraco TaxID=1234273 RepID=UPI001FEDDDBA|nr:mucin-2 isoform X1 [Tachysurus fulvidraco]